MMSDLIKVRKREGRGKKNIAELKGKGMLPGVIYGHGFEPIPLEMEARDIMAVFRSRKGIHGIFELMIEDEGSQVHKVMVKEVQKHPFKEIMLHVDFQRVREDESVRTMVPIRYVGDSVGVKMGGLLQHYVLEVEVECLPLNVPDHVDLDVTELTIGKNLRVRDLPKIEGIKYVNKPEEVVVMVAAKKVRTHEAEEEAALAEKAEEEQVSETADTASEE